MIKLQYFGHLMQRVNSLEKIEGSLGKIEGKRRMRWLDGNTNSGHMSLSRLKEIVKDSKLGMLQSMGSQRVRHNLANEQDIHHRLKDDACVLEIGKEFYK